ncbi:putative ABC transporter permease subunit [Fonticella tunisiensis]|uniref:ABC-2 type transport system permease protein n=1 Tax=Fonticella tunisiensis TaxID=1096341 RepID=A0A4R7KS76_9CLOT|nr:hypothetical protein [Fonticella tunisiensis]TDT62360.1 ABC-2 type transport system permease protein [Fonticella tunisiensis]
MKKAWALTKIYINSLYGISGFINSFKTNKKSAFKTIALILLILIGLLGTASAFIIYNIQLYDILRPINQQGIIISNSFIFAAMFTLIFGIVGIIATYFVDKEGDIILSMPLKPWNLLFAKFFTSYLYEAVLSLIIMATGVIVYGVKSGEGLLFYIISFIVSLLIPVIPLVVSYIVIIPLMKVANFLKKKDVVMIISGFIGALFGVVIQLSFQDTMMKMNKNPEVLREIFTFQNGMVSIASRIYPPSTWGTYAIIDISSTRGFTGLMLLLLTAAVAVILLHCFMSEMYLRSLIGSTEVRKSERKMTEKELKMGLRRRNILTSLLLREIRLMNREPIFFLNGPFVIFLIPAILGAMLFIQRDVIAAQLGTILRYNTSSYYSTLIVAGMGAFLGSMSSIASSAISREGKAFMYLKSMPIEPVKYINAKLLHAGIFGVMAGFITCAIGYFLMGVTIGGLMLAFIISQLLMLPSFICGLLLELTWPKLIWDNPQKAVKQNINVVIIIFGGMIFLYGTAAAVYFLLKTPIYGYLVLTIVLAVINVVLYACLISYGRKRFYEIEA